MRDREALGRLIEVGTGERPTAIELFAGVGGFRLALEATGWSVVWSNQWEPATKAQHASDCYVAPFRRCWARLHGHHSSHSTSLEGNPWVIPDHDLVVGGFPCQDYSVAKTLNQAHGIVGKKGVLWWEIHRLLDQDQAADRILFLENVDRLLKSPATQRGRDFAIMLASLSDSATRSSGAWSMRPTTASRRSGAACSSSGDFGRVGERAATDAQPGIGSNATASWLDRCPSTRGPALARPRA